MTTTTISTTTTTGETEMTKTNPIAYTPQPPTTYTYQVSYTEIRGMAPLRKTVEAAYFQSEDGFTVFKDAKGKAVYAIKNDILCAIERVNQTGPNQTG